jgi:pantetheine-phosphate adenylyltransferase
MKTAIFPGSFDPFTLGHQAVVEQALHLFDKVVIAIGENVGKRSLLTAEARLRLISDLYKNDERVECITYSTLTGDVARKVGASAIVRGVRNTIDFEYERTMALTNSRLFPEIETVILLTPPALADVSSSTVRELHAFGRDVQEMMPQGVNIEDYME